MTDELRYHPATGQLTYRPSDGALVYCVPCKQWPYNPPYGPGLHVCYSLNDHPHWNSGTTGTAGANCALWIQAYSPAGSGTGNYFIFVYDDVNDQWYLKCWVQNPGITWRDTSGPTFYGISQMIAIAAPDIVDGYIIGTWTIPATYASDGATSITVNTNASGNCIT